MLKRLSLLLALPLVLLAAWAGQVPPLEPIVETSNQLDVAIDGRGFFEVQRRGTGETYYTRLGSLSINAESELCVGSPHNGWLLEPGIVIPPEATNVVIEDDGTVLYLTSPDTTLITAGNMVLTRFASEGGLAEVMAGFYLETPTSGVPQTLSPGQNGAGLLRQGCLLTAQTDSPWNWQNAAILATLVLVGWTFFEVRLLRHRLAELEAAWAELLWQRRRPGCRL